MAKVIRNHLGRLQAQIHMLKKLSADMKENESLLNAAITAAEKHGCSVEVSPYYSYRVDPIQWPGGVSSENIVGDTYGWDIFIRTNGNLTIDKKKTVEEVLEYIQQQCLAPKPKVTITRR